VIDSAHIARSVITTERAFVISYKGNADIIASHPESFGLVNPNLDIKKPSIIKVRQYVDVRHQKVPFNRDNIYKRDNYSCVYCGHNRRKDLTLDHVNPQAKGGRDSWDNLVTACFSCNQEKADLSIDDYVMMKMENGEDIEYPDPKRPHYLMLMKKMDYIPPEWDHYLFL
jgi:5-methylcytosine-specific restriction endonuclease McrA